MSQLSTVADYVQATRRVMQDMGDLVGGNFRYPDADIIDALNQALLEARRLRPDLFLNSTPVSFTPPFFTANDTTVVPMDFQYRMALVFFMAGVVQLRDMEDVQDNRATKFMQDFTAKLTSVGA